jgi:beta,beta-carotene 9',10'-dioxygenase
MTIELASPIHSVSFRGPAAATQSVDLAERAPFRRSPDADLELSAKLEGELPRWLAGDLLRTCPAVFQTGSWQARHWFDALGMLYRFRVQGGSVTYRQRLMDSDVSRQAKAGGVDRISFGTPSDRNLLSRVLSPVPKSTDNANVNVVALGDERVALTESPHQWVVDADSLALRHKVEYSDAEGQLGMIAHPHFDFERDRVVSLATRIGPKTQILLYEHAPNARERSVVGQIEVRRLPYIHAFGLTPRHAIVIGHPFEVNPLSLLGSKRGFIDHFVWRPEQGTRLWLIDRKSGQVRTHSAPSGFVFHVVNAFEDGERTCLDVALYPNADIIEQLRTSALANQGFPEFAPSIVRWSMRAGKGAATSEALFAQGFEFPQVSYRKHNGQRYSVAFGARIERVGDAPKAALVRADLEAGERRFERAGFVFGEPLFVAQPGASGEADGVVLAVGSHVAEARSAMVVLDATTFELRAWAEVPLPIPLGFHGSFFRARGR